MTTLSLSNVSCAYRDRPALRDVSATLEGGALTAIVGPNGAGKSTFLRVAAGLMAPQSGTASINDAPVLTLQPRQRARRIAYLAQTREAAWPLRARRVVELARAPWSGPLGRMSADDHAAVDEALATADATQFADRAITELSGGERARVLLARALAVGAEVLLADEPAADLDPYQQLIALDALKARATAGGAVAVVLHDLALAARTADHVIVLNAGRVAISGPPEEALSDACLAEVFGVRAVDGLNAGGLVRAKSQ